MAIKYYLRQNALAKESDSHNAVVVPREVLNLQSIIAKMLKRGTTLSEADIIASLHLLFEVVTQELQEGNHVNLPIVNIKPSISGTFANALESFDASKHRITSSTSSGILLKNNLKNTSVEKVIIPVANPVLSAFFDIKSQTINDIISPNGIGQIVGYNLKFNDRNPNEGVFFVNTDNETFQTSIFAIRHPRKLVFSIPATLPEGNYTLIVKKAYGKTASTLKKATLNHQLKVI